MSNSCVFIPLLHWIFIDEGMCKHACWDTAFELKRKLIDLIRKCFCQFLITPAKGAKKQTVLPITWSH